MEPFDLNFAIVYNSGVVEGLSHAHVCVLQFDVLAIVAYCCAYTAFIAYTVPNLGTLYRMRAFPFALIVSTAIAVFLTRIIPSDTRQEEITADA